MTYQDSKGNKYLIYLYSDYRNLWKIENLPFNGTVRQMSEQDKNQFIKSNGLKMVKK